MHRKVRSICILVLLLMAVHGHAQLTPMPGAANWWTTDQPLSPGEVLPLLEKSLQLPDQSNFKLISTHTDRLGIQHAVYQQFYASVPVEGAMVKIHFNPNKVTLISEYIINDLSHIASPKITSKEALSAAMAMHQGKRYIWEAMSLSPTSIHQPVPRLLIKRPLEENEKPLLVYEVTLFSIEPLQKTHYYVNAATGDVIDAYNDLCMTSVEGVAHTRYHGIRTFTTDSIGPELYRLRDYSRGDGIETYDMNQGGFIDKAVDFIDRDNIWDTVNSYQDEVAHDVHWGAQQAYDYFLHTHQLNSYDGNGAKIRSYVHFGIKYVNAFWSGSWMAYGDADSSVGYYPLTTIDVVAHELTHGVTDKSSDLIYRNEPGALNESFSDIFGKAVEWYADSAHFSWRVARQAVPGPGGIRSMINPNAFNNPDTYKGALWESGSFDNGGVHINSGVQNKWFQLLVDGGTHANDNGDTVTVPSIGWEKATAIAYRNNHIYLSRFSQYQDARIGSLLAARDLYGQCSPTYQAVATAWYAVGLGTAALQHDLAITDIDVANGCGLSDQEPVTVTLFNNSCADTLPTGSTLMLAMEVNQGTTSIDTLALSQDWLPNTAVQLALPTTADLSAVREHTLRIWLMDSTDLHAKNDTLIQTTRHREVQNVNFEMEDIQGPEGYCFMSASEPLTLRIRFRGCDSVAAGTEVPVSFWTVGGVAVNDTLVLPNTLMADNRVDLTTNKGIDLSDYGTYEVRAAVHYPGDVFTGNDTSRIFTIKVPYQFSPNTGTRFVNFTKPLDSFRLETGFRAEAQLSILGGNGSGPGLQMSGTAVNPRPRYDIPDSANVWQINNSSRATACWCVDASQAKTLALTFDVRQTRARVHTTLAGEDIPYSSPMRVLVNGQQVTGTYLPDTYSDDPWQQEVIMLDSFAGQQIEVCFESRALSNSAGDVPENIGDNTFLDNVFFGLRTSVLSALPTPEAWSLFPNPATHQLQIIIPRWRHPLLQIINTHGEVVWHGTLQAENVNSIPIAALAPGFYVAQVAHEQGMAKKPFIIAR